MNSGSYSEVAARQLDELEKSADDDFWDAILDACELALNHSAVAQKHSSAVVREDGSVVFRLASPLTPLTRCSGRSMLVKPASKRSSLTRRSHPSVRPGPRDALGELGQGAVRVGEGTLLPHQVDHGVRRLDAQGAHLAGADQHRSGERHAWSQ